MRLRTQPVIPPGVIPGQILNLNFKNWCWQSSQEFIYIIYQKFRTEKISDKLIAEIFSAEMLKYRAEFFSAEIFSRRNFFRRNYEKSRRNFFRRNFWVPFFQVDEKIYVLHDWSHTPSQCHSTFNFITQHCDRPSSYRPSDGCRTQYCYTINFGKNNISL